MTVCTELSEISGPINIPNVHNSHWNSKGPRKSGIKETYLVLVNPSDHRILFHLFLSHINQCSLEHILETWSGNETEAVD